MKGKKKYIVLLVLLCAFMGFLYFTKDKRKEQIKKQDEKIDEDAKLREKKAIKLTNYIKIDKDKYGEYDSKAGNLLKFKKDKVFYILDNKGKELYFGVNEPEILLNYNETKTYYFVNNALYDSEGNIIYDKIENGSSVAYINDDDIVINTGFDKGQIINIKSKDIKNIESFIGYYKGIYVYIKNGKYVVFDNGEKEYDDLYTRASYSNDNSIIHLKSKTDDIYLDVNKGKITKDDYLKEKLNDKYYLYHDKCATVKSYSDDKNVLDECIFDYDKINDNYFAFVTINDEKSIYLLRNDKIEKETGYIRGEVADDIYYAAKGEKENYFSAFYENGESKELECAAIVGYAGNNIFSCGDLFESYFIENNKIRDDKYDYISCGIGGDYCIVSNNNKEGLYYMGEKIIEPIYKNILIEDGYIIQELEDSYYIYYTEKDGKRLKKDDLNPKEEEKKYEADVDKIVEEYKLDKDLVKDNKDLFIKYASIVEKNDGLKDYKKYIYDYFKVVVEKKDYIDEELFFNSLNNLFVVIKDKLEVNGAAGLYYSTDNHIELLPKYATYDSVVYHEFMHFIDHKLNNNESENICLYNKKAITKNDYLKLSIEEKRKVDCNFSKNELPKFMKEGGAELYSSRYFFNSYTRTYDNAVGLYYIFEYLLGEDTMNDIYYGHKNFYGELIKYISDVEYEKLDEATDRMTDINGEIQSNDYSNMFDILIKIYTNSKGKEWYNDNTFGLLLDNTFDLYYLKKSRYYNIYEKISNYNNNEKIRLSNLMVEKSDLKESYYPRIIYENNGIVLTRLSDYSNDKNNKIYKFKYDANKKTIEKIGVYDYKYE